MSVDAGHGTARGADGFLALLERESKLAELCLLLLDHGLLLRGDGSEVDDELLRLTVVDADSVAVAVVARPAGRDQVRGVEE